METVRRILVEKGVELPRIQTIALGDANPIGDNKTQEGRCQNRRVAVKLFTLGESPETVAPPDDSAPPEIPPPAEPTPGSEDAEGPKE